MRATREAIEWDDEQFDRALNQAAEGAVEVQNVRLSEQQIDRLLAALPRCPDDPRQAQVQTADFRGTTFEGAAAFDQAKFIGDAHFDGATFSEAASFNGATFSGTANFGRATFGGPANFADTTFSGTAGFGFANFSGVANFDRAVFRRIAGFGFARFTAAARFDHATFSGEAFFDRAIFSAFAVFDFATFISDVRFWAVTFGAYARFAEAVFAESVAFDGARFEVEAELGPVHVYGLMSLERVVFAARVKIEASALRASFTRAEFPRGADLWLRWADVWLEGTEFGGPSLTAALPARASSEGGKGLLGWEKLGQNGVWYCPVADEPPNDFDPWVLSASGARVGMLTFSGVHLEKCRFAGAHGLDALGLDRVEFPRPPAGWRWARGWPVRWTRRQTIAEEHYWRARGRNGAGWAPGQLPTGSPPWPPQPPADLEPGRIAGLYRRLRKSREDSKDEPGANDFYYGEMEMRRRSGPLAERSILWLYWLTAGYGLRASRALFALAITIAILGAIPLTLWGFHPQRSYGGMLLFSLQSSISLLRAPTSQPAGETAGGQVVEIFLRLAGPLFFGLALLALRGRVKR